MSELAPRPPLLPGDELIRFLDRAIIMDHLDALSGLSKPVLLGVLVPNRHLPTHDPAGYLIAQHNELYDEDEVELRTTYDLGVVFGRSLLVKAIKKAAPEDKVELPIIDEFTKDATDKKRLVDDYLKESRQRSVDLLTRNGSRLHGDLYRAVDVFGQSCVHVLPHLMIDGRDELLRGCHDYLSAVTLLETQNPEQAGALRRLLGRISVGQRVRDMFHTHPGRRAA